MPWSSSRKDVYNDPTVSQRHGTLKRRKVFIDHRPHRTFSCSELSQREIARRWPVTCRVATSCLLPSQTGPNGSKKIFRRVGNASAVLSPTSSCRAGTIRDANSSDSYKFFMVVNGCNSSNHSMFSILSCQFGCENGA